MASKRVAEWEKAKATFVSLVTKEDPANMGKKQIVDPVIEKHDGEIVKNLKTCDELEDKITKMMKETKPDYDDIEKELRKFEQTTRQFHDTADKMIKELNTAIENSKKGNEDPKVKEKYKRGCKVLKTELDELDTSNLEWFVVQSKDVQAKSKKEEAAENQADKYRVSLKAALSRGNAVVQRIKAKPNAENYNKEFPKAASDIADQVDNFAKLAKKGIGDIPGPKDPSNLSKDLKPFAEGNMKKVDPPGDERKILAQIKQFSNVVKEVAKDYKL